jgi:NADPH-dependent ferric siderophore reductase
MPKTTKWIADAMERWLPSIIPVMDVLQTTYLSSSIKRILLKGEIKDLNFQVGYAVAIRVNETAYRNYTPSFVDAANGLMEITAHLRAKGPGSQFLASLKLGQQVRISIPRGKKMLTESLDSILVFGDESSLGLVCAMAAWSKQGNQACRFFLELDPENMEVPDMLGIDNCVIVPKQKVFNNEGNIAMLLANTPKPSRSTGIIITGNAASLQNIRNHFRRTSAGSHILAQAYWAAGKTGL